jgi:hypothetical protein
MHKDNIYNQCFVSQNLYAIEIRKINAQSFKTYAWIPNHLQLTGAN